MSKGYIFDYGGTLDTGGQHWGRLLWRLYARYEVPVTEAQFREAYVYAERTLAKTPIIQPDFTFKQTLQAKIHLQLSYLSQQVAQTVLLHPSSVMHSNQLSDLMQFEQPLTEAAWSVAAYYTTLSARVLRQLSASYPLVLVSNFYGNIHAVLEEFKLASYFTSVVESAVVGVRKPDSAIFQLGVDALHLPAHDVTVVGDSISKDIIPAQQIGCRTVWLRSEGWTDDPVDETIPNQIIKSIAELLSEPHAE